MTAFLFDVDRPKRYEEAQPPWTLSDGTEAVLDPTTDPWSPERILARVLPAARERAARRGEDFEADRWRAIVEMSCYLLNSMADGVAAGYAWPDEVLGRVDIVGAALDAVLA